MIPMEYVLSEKVELVNSGPMIKFMGRSFLQKVARIIYKIIRSLYVSLFFYFFPILPILLMIWSLYNKNLDTKEWGAK
jgi:hypothetical protein